MKIKELLSMEITKKISCIIILLVISLLSIFVVSFISKLSLRERSAFI